MSDADNWLESTVSLAAQVREARRKLKELEIPLGDCAVGYRYAVAKFGWNRSTIWRMEQAGRFPRGVIVNGKHTWRKSVIDAHFDALYPKSDNT
jgi:predicted DNA-binding transcriptional regulator AlpA